MNLAVNLLLVSFLSIFAESAILGPVGSRCPASTVPYVRLRKTAERETLSEIAELAESIPGSRACGHSVATYDSAYRRLLCAAGVASTPEINATFYEAVGDISKSMYKACYGSDRIGIGDFAAIKAKYETAYKKKNITELRKAYGSLVCLMKKVSTRAKRTPTVAPGTPNAAIINFYCTIQNANHVGRLFFDPLTGGKYSVAFVLDDTGSMGPHIEIAKCLVRSFLASGVNGPEKYILGTFNDPEPNTWFYDPKEYDSSDISQMTTMLSDLASIKACCDAGVTGCYCGRDWPEYGMGGISRAIDKSIRYPETGNDEFSHIILFTDAPAKDYSSRNFIKTKLETKNPDPNLPDLYLHGFLHNLVDSSPLPSSCYATPVAYENCIKNTGRPYMEVVNSVDGILVNSISNAGFDTFVNAYTGGFGSYLPATSCTSKKRSAPLGCRNFVVSEFAYHLSVVIHPHGTTSITIQDSSAAVVKNIPTLSSLSIYSFNNPVSGSWSVCSNGSLDIDINIKNSFRFSVDFIRGDSKPVDTIPSPGCPISILILSAQLGSLSSSASQRVDLISSNGKTLQQVKLTSCDGYLRGLITVPKETFYFRFQGISTRGYAFESTQLTKNVPTPWSLVLSTVTAPKQISKGSSKDYVFTLSTAKRWPSCSLPVKITATTAISGVGLSVNPSTVVLSGSPVSFRVTVAPSGTSPTGRGTINLSFADTTGRNLKNETVAIGIGTPAPGCQCKNGGRCVTVRRFGRLRTSCVCPPSYYGGLCEIFRP